VNPNHTSQPSSAAAGGSYVSWPPPGLEQLHGRLWSLIPILAIGNVVLLLPLLSSVVTQQEFSSLGPFGHSWWIVLLTTVVGVVILIAGFERLVRVCWIAGAASAQGHGWLMIAHVLTDGPRDTGFLLQGARLYAEVAVSQRKTILLLRLLGTAGYTAAVLLAPLGFVISVMLASRGWVGPAAITTLTLVVPLVLVALGSVCRTTAYVFARTPRGDRKRRAAVDEEVRREIATWNEQFDDVTGRHGFTTGSPSRRRTFRLVAAGVALLGLAVVVQSTVLTFTGAVVPIVVSIAIPDIGQIQARVFEGEVLRHYRVDPDPGITPEAAGEALHTLLAVGRPIERYSLEQRPVREYDQPWFPDRETTEFLQDKASWAWALEVLERASGGLTVEERAYLSVVAAHPAQREFSTVAQARTTDIIGTRYAFPLPDTITAVALPIPWFGFLRNAAAAHAAAAALDLSDGRHDRAERAVREVISLGFTLIDHGPSMIDNMIGARIVNAGGDALELVLQATGRRPEAENLARVRTQVKAMAYRATLPRVGESVEGALRAMPAIVLDTTAARGLRWEFFGLVSSFAPCLNLHTMVFGPGEEYETWRHDARQALVQGTKDSQLFEIMGRGMFGPETCAGLLGEL